MAAHLELALGRVARADTLLALARELDPTAELVVRGHLASIPFFPVPRAKLEELRTEFIEWNAEAVPPSEDPRAIFSAHDGAYVFLREFLLGLLDVRLGDLKAATVRAASLRQVEGSGEAEELARRLAGTLQASILWGRDDPASALRELEELPVESQNRMGLVINSPFYSRVYERYLRAELLREVGREEEALRWYGSLEENYPLYDLTYLAYSHLQRGEIQEDLGRHELAEEHYTRAAELWQGCDSVFEPRRRRAEAGLGRLERNAA